MRSIQEETAAVEAAKKEARQAQAWLQFLTGHTDVQNCESNRRVSLEYFNGEEMTLPGLLDSYNSPSFRALLAFRVPQNERAESIATISRITGVTDSPLTKWQTNDELATKASELETRREMIKKSPDELRQIIKDSKPVVVQQPLPPEMTRKAILALPAKDLRRLLDKFGSLAVNQRLSQL